jgi:ATP-binding cassette subfamily B protein
VATFFLAIGSAMSLLYPQAVRSIVDEALTTRNLTAVDRWAFLIFAVSALQAAAAAIRYFLFTLAGERVVVRLRESLYSRLLDQEIAFFDTNRTGELMSRLTADCSVLQNAVSVNISIALRNLTGALGGLVLLIYTSPKLAFIVLLIIPPIAGFAGAYGRKIRNFSKKSQDALAQASTVAEETLSGVRTVRFFAQENFERRRYGEALQESLRAARERIRQVSLFSGFASAFGYAAVAAVLWAGGRMVVSGSMSVGDLTQFLLYLMVVAFSVAALGSLWGDFMSALGAAKRVFELLERKPAIANASGKTLVSLEGRVEFREVGFHYPSRKEVEVLRGFSLTIEPGKSVALVGPSGGGKTTVASLLVRLYDPTSGEVRIDGTRIDELEPDWLRAQIGVVSQEPVLISASITENIRYGKPSATDEEVEQAARIANAHDFISRFPDRYATLVGERGIQLSGGQKQRVAIARAVLKDPKILILDEATSALDTESERLVQEALARLMKGRSTLVIAHRLATIRGADTIAVIENGRVVESGTHEELIKNPASHYAGLIQQQMNLR